jgi:phospholipase C
MLRLSYAALLCLNLLPLGCGLSVVRGVAPATPAQPQKIRHIVVITQENRTFNSKCGSS